MKKTLSIILCLSLLLSTFAFASPAPVVDMSQVGVESAEEFASADLSAEADNENAVLAADEQPVVTYTFANDFASSGVDSSQMPYYVVDDNTTVSVTNKNSSVAVAGGFATVTNKAVSNKVSVTFKDAEGEPTTFTAGKYKVVVKIKLPAQDNKGKDVTAWSFALSDTSTNAGNVVTSGIAPGNWVSVPAEFELTEDTRAYTFYLVPQKSPAGTFNYAASYEVDDIVVTRIPEAVTVKYNLNGGTAVDTDALADAAAATGVAQTLPGAAALSRQYYTFAGWSTSATATEGVYSYTPSRNDFDEAAAANTITLYAVWTANTYNITINPNGGTLNIDDTVSFKEADGVSKYTLPSAGDVAYEGYILGGWTDGLNVYKAGQKVDVSAATTFTAIWKSYADLDILSPVATAPEFGATNVDLRYPVAYYTFDQEIDPSTVTVENLKNSKATGVYLDEDTNTILVFPEPSSAHYGKTVSYDAWVSDIMTADASAILAFPAAKFTMASEMVHDGENLTPFSNMEYGWNPFYVTISGGSKQISSELIEENGNHYAAFRINHQPSQSWFYAHNNVLFSSNTTYKMRADIKLLGFTSSAANSSTTAGILLNTRYQSGDTVDHPSLPYEHNVNGFRHDFSLSDGWVNTGWQEQTIRNVIKLDNERSTMTVYSNPANGGVNGGTSFAVDNLEVYEKVGTSFAAGYGTTLVGTAPETLYGYNGDVLPLPDASAFEVDDDRWTISGWTDGENVYDLGGNLTVKGQRTLVPYLTTTDPGVNFFTVTFVGEDGAEVPAPVNVIEGETLVFDSTLSCVAPQYEMFLGWTVDGVNTVESIVVTQDITVTAVFALKDKVVFNAAGADAGITVDNGEGTLDLDNDVYKITPNSDSADAYFVINNQFNVPASIYKKVRVAYNTTISGVANKLVENMSPAFQEDNRVFFTTDTATGINWNKSAKANFYGFDEENPAIIIYEFDFASNADWNGYIRSIRVDPYNGAPDWGVSYVEFVKNEIVETVEISGIDAPSLRGTPDMDAVVPEGVKYAVESIVWSPNVADKFLGNTEYTATVTVVSTSSDTSLYTTTEVYFEDEPVDAVYSEATGAITFDIAFEATPDYVPANVNITGGNEITVADGKITLTGATVVVNQGDTVDTDAVTWSIESGAEFAEIDANGVVTAYYDGTVVVKATSVYNPAVSNTHTITITNQAPANVITFDKGTNAVVSGMPEQLQGKRTVSLENVAVPTRTGYRFIGWKLSPEAESTVDSVVLNEDMTLYAQWGKGVYFEFNQDGNFEGFTSHSGLSVKEVKNGYLHIEGNPAVKDINSSNSSSNINADLYKKATVRIRTPQTASFAMYFKIKGAEDIFNESTKASASFTGSDDWQIITLDYSKNTRWYGTVALLRMDYADYEGLEMDVDYIRFENSAVEQVAVTGIDTPVAKALADTDAVSVDTSKYTVKSVTWKEPLLYDYYYDGETAYTVEVTLTSSAGYALSDAPLSATIDGNEAQVRVADNGSDIILSYQYPATEVIDNYDTSAWTFVTLPGTPDESVYVRNVFVGDTVDVSTTEHTATLDKYTRFEGWALEEGGEAQFDVTSTGDDLTFYAQYGDFTYYDFSNPYHTVGITAPSWAGTVSFDGTNAVVHPNSSTADVYLATPVIGKPTSDYGRIEVVYDAQTYSTDVITTSIKPELYFALSDAPSAYAGSKAGKIISSEAVTIDGLKCVKFTYDLQSNTNWKGTIGTFRTEPYNGTPVWGVRSIRLVPNEIADETIELTNIPAPETWEKAAGKATVLNDEMYAVVGDIVWTGDRFFEDGAYFANETVYTANVTLKAVNFHMFGDEVTATVDGNEAAVVKNDDGTVTVSYTFEEATLPLADVEVSITGADVIQRNGRYEELKATVVGVNGERIPNRNVTWSIETLDSTDVAATITENGRVLPLLDGTVRVTATSKYDTTKSATHDIVITNQSSKYVITFDPNTTDVVTGMPDDEAAKGTFKLPDAVPEREGYIFDGWVTDPDSRNPVTSITVSEDTTIYATWAKGIFLEMTDSIYDSTGVARITGANGTIVDGHYAFTTTSTDPMTRIYFTQGAVNTDDYDTLVVRFKTTNTSDWGSQCWFTTQKNVGGTWEDVVGDWPDPAFNKTATYPAFTPDENGYATVRIDLSAKAAWNEGNFVNFIRFDPYDDHQHPTEVAIDYMRLLSSKNTVTFDPQGGAYPVGGDLLSYDPVVGTYKTGSHTISFVPLKENCKFMGWSKNADGSGKLYTDTVVVNSDCTFYAVWNTEVDFGALTPEDAENTVSALDPETEETLTTSVTGSGLVIKGTDKTVNVAPVIDIANELVVTEQSSTVLMYMGYSYSRLVTPEVTLRYKAAGANEYSYATLIDNAPIKADPKYYAIDLSGVDGLEGTVTDVSIILPEGALNSFMVSEVTFTSKNIAEETISNFYAEDEVSIGNATATAKRKLYVPVAQPTKPAPTLGGGTGNGSATEAVDITTKTSSKDTITFDFVDESDSQLFASYRQMSLDGISNSIASFTSNGLKEGSNDSPAVFCSTKMRIDAATHKYVVIRAKADLDKDGMIQVYFQTDTDPKFSEAKSKKLAVTDAYSVIAYDMSTVQGWNGTITSISLSLNGNVKGTVDFDYIMFTDTVPEDKGDDITKFPYVNKFDSAKFTDVTSADWFYGDVEKSYRLGFMNGVSETLFSPNGNVTIAETITVAARINAIYNGKEIKAAAEGEEWYAPYVKYATDNGIIRAGTFADVTVPATRAQVASIISFCVPSEWLNAINMFVSIPDVTSSNPAYSDILFLYNAGIVIGVDDEFNFNPDSNIKRSEISAIINRIAFPDSRKRVMTQAEIDSLKLSFTGEEIATKCGISNTAEAKFTLKNGLATATGKLLDNGKGDPIVSLSALIEGGLDPKLYKTIKVSMKYDTTKITTTPVIYFVTPAGGWAEARKLTSKIESVDEATGIVTFIFEASKNGAWADNITNARFDPFDAVEEFGIASIEFLPSAD